jgi:flap endonuclease GEN
MSVIEEKLRLSRQKLIALSLLCGCDYNDIGVLGVGKETALKFLEGLEDDEILPR